MSVSAASSAPSSAASSIAEFKGAFFDKDVVLRAMDKATRKALSKFGAFVRRTSRTSIKYSADSSAPGSAARGHKSRNTKKTNKKTGIAKIQSVSPLREWILFAYSAETKTVIIGPAKTNQRAVFSGEPIPQVLEHGGAIQIHEHLHTFASGETIWARSDLRRRADHWLSAIGKPQRVRTVRISPRPTMQLALDAELPKLAGMFEGQF